MTTRVLEAFISIGETPATVERHLTSEDLLPLWMSPLITFDLLDGTWMSQGSTYRAAIKTLALLPAATYTLVARDAQRLRFDFSGLWRGTETWHWFADGDRTIVHNRIAYDLANPLLGLMVAQFGFVLIQLDMRVQLEKLRNVIEGRARASGKQAGPPR